MISLHERTSILALQENTPSASIHSHHSLSTRSEYHHHAPFGEASTRTRKCSNIQKKDERYTSDSSSSYHHLRDLSLIVSDISTMGSVEDLEEDEDNSTIITAIREHSEQMDSWFEDDHGNFEVRHCIILEEDEDGLQEEILTLQYSQEKLRQEMEVLDLILSPRISGGGSFFPGEREGGDTYSDVTDFLEQYEQRLQDHDDSNCETMDLPTPRDGFYSSCRPMNGFDEIMLRSPFLLLTCIRGEAGVLAQVSSPRRAIKNTIQRDPKVDFLSTPYAMNRSGRTIIDSSATQRFPIIDVTDAEINCYNEAGDNDSKGEEDPLVFSIPYDSPGTEKSGGTPREPCMEDPRSGADHSGESCFGETTLSPHYKTRSQSTTSSNSIQNAPRMDANEEQGSINTVETALSPLHIASNQLIEGNRLFADAKDSVLWRPNEQDLDESPLPSPRLATILAGASPEKHLVAPNLMTSHRQLCHEKPQAPSIPSFCSLAAQDDEPQSFSISEPISGVVESWSIHLTSEGSQGVIDIERRSTVEASAFPRPHKMSDPRFTAPVCLVSPSDTMKARSHGENRYVFFHREDRFKEKSWDIRTVEEVEVYPSPFRDMMMSPLSESSSTGLEDTFGCCQITACDAWRTNKKDNPVMGEDLLQRAVADDLTESSSDGIKNLCRNHIGISMTESQYEEDLPSFGVELILHEIVTVSECDDDWEESIDTAMDEFRGTFEELGMTGQPVVLEIMRENELEASNDEDESSTDTASCNRNEIDISVRENSQYSIERMEQKLRPVLSDGDTGRLADTIGEVSTRSKDFGQRRMNRRLGGPEEINHSKRNRRDVRKTEPSEGKDSLDVTELVHCNEKLLESIVNFDYATYSALVSEDLTGIECGEMQVGVRPNFQNHHKNYPSTMGVPTKISLVNPAVRLLSSTVALVTYTRVDEFVGTDQRMQWNETRVWEKRRRDQCGGEYEYPWLNCHYHQSKSSNP